MAKRDDNRARKKKARREKRKQKAAAARPPALPPALRNLARILSVPPPATWPGAADPALARPDLVKAELGELSVFGEPGRSKAKALEDRLTRGVLHFMPQLSDWALEEFLYHGLPGDPWQPIDHFLEHRAGLLPPAAREQLRLWQQARIGLYEVGEVADDTVVLREWDPFRAAAGAPFRTITLNIGGVNVQREMGGRVLLTYVAPWAPAEGIWCGMGYGFPVTKADVPMVVPYLGLRHPEVVTRPLPWRESRAAADAAMRQWRTRDWHGWLRERLQFPFWAAAPLPPDGRPRLVSVRDLIPTTPEQARRFGIYFEVPVDGGKEVVVAGGTTVTPVEVAGPNLAALLEYHAYRDRAGPPPGAAGQPTFPRVR